MGKKIFFYGLGGYKNRGCEAIVKSTASLIRKNFKDVNIAVATSQIDYDSKQLEELIDYYTVHSKFKKISFDRLKSIMYSKLFKDIVSASGVVYKNAVDEGARADISFSIGGDNYCYGKPYWLFGIDQGIKKAGGKTVLWGCSIEPEDIDAETIKDLDTFDLIVTRESITYNALLSSGVKANVQLNPDPAFTLEKEYLSLPENWQEGNMIGFNISPLIMSYERNSGMAFKASLKLVDYIISKTGYSIALIPHVTWDNGNDLIPLKEIYSKYKQSKRVVLISGDHNASQLKGFIARCKYFIGARTHATIAAYSSCIPTLVIGYSVKAIGIARDLFSNENDLVIPVQNITDDNQLIKSFQVLEARGGELKEHLNNIMPGYIKRSEDSIEHIKKLLVK